MIELWSGAEYKTDKSQTYPLVLLHAMGDVHMLGLRYLDQVPLLLLLDLSVSPDRRS